MGERLHKVLGQIDLGTLDSGERSLPFGLLVYQFSWTFHAEKHVIWLSVHFNANSRDSAFNLVCFSQGIYSLYGVVWE